MKQRRYRAKKDVFRIQTAKWIIGTADEIHNTMILLLKVGDVIIHKEEGIFTRTDGTLVDLGSYASARNYLKRAYELQSEKET